MAARSQHPDRMTQSDSFGVSRSRLQPILPTTMIVEVPPPMTSWREREARNEAHARDRNEWIERASQSFGADSPTETFVCECGDGDCAQPIELTWAEYESVRSVSNRFAVALNHENPESEEVISECARFASIDKIEGWGLRVARATDPRSGPTAPPRPP